MKKPKGKDYIMQKHKQNLTIPVLFLILVIIYAQPYTTDPQKKHKVDVFWVITTQTSTSDRTVKQGVTLSIYNSGDFPEYIEYKLSTDEPLIIWKGGWDRSNQTKYIRVQEMRFRGNNTTEYLTNRIHSYFWISPGENVRYHFNFVERDKISYVNGKLIILEDTMLDPNSIHLWFNTSRVMNGGLTVYQPVILSN